MSGLKEWFEAIGLPEPEIDIRRLEKVFCKSNGDLLKDPGSVSVEDMQAISRTIEILKANDGDIFNCPVVADDIPLKYLSEKTRAFLECRTLGELAQKVIPIMSIFESVVNRVVEETGITAETAFAASEFAFRWASKERIELAKKVGKRLMENGYSVNLTKKPGEIPVMDILGPGEKEGTSSVEPLYLAPKSFVPDGWLSGDDYWPHVTWFLMEDEDLQKLLVRVSGNGGLCRWAIKNAAFVKKASQLDAANLDLIRDFCRDHFQDRNIPASYKALPDAEKEWFSLLSRFVNRVDQTMDLFLRKYCPRYHEFDNVMIFADKINQCLVKIKKAQKEETKLVLLKNILVNLSLPIFPWEKDKIAFVNSHLETNPLNLESILVHWDICREGKTIKEMLEMVSLGVRPSSNEEDPLVAAIMAPTKEEGCEVIRKPAPAKTFRIDGKSFLFFDCSNPEDLKKAVYLGHETHCCQKFGHAAVTCMYHGVFDEDSSFLGIYDKAGKLMAQSWTWWIGDSFVLDNIELAPFKTDEESLAYVRNAYVNALEALPFSNVYIGLGYTKLKINGGVRVESNLDMCLRGEQYDYSDTHSGSVQVKKDGIILPFNLSWIKEVEEVEEDDIDPFYRERDLLNRMQNEN